MKRAFKSLNMNRIWKNLMKLDLINSRVTFNLSKTLWPICEGGRRRGVADFIINQSRIITFNFYSSWIRPHSSTICILTLRNQLSQFTNWSFDINSCPTIRTLRDNEKTLCKLTLTDEKLHLMCRTRKRRKCRYFSKYLRSYDQFLK